VSHGIGVVDERKVQAPRHCEQERFQNLRHDVSGSDQVNVVAALLLQRQHHLSQLFGLRRLSFALPTDFIVLAENATQIAPAEKDGSRAARAAQTALLAEVSEIAADRGVAPGPASLGLVLQTIDFAVARTQGAIGQLFYTKGDAARQFSGSPQCEVGGMELFLTHTFRIAHLFLSGTVASNR